MSDIDNDPWPGEHPAFGLTIDNKHEPLLVDSAGRVILSPLSDISVGSTRSVSANVASVPIETTETLVLDSNLNRKAFCIYNASNGPVYLKFGTGITESLYTYKMNINCLFGSDTYSGIVTAICDDTATLLVTEEI